jgi:electron transport complex protein RnfC
MIFPFQGGVHPEGHKDATRQKPIEPLPPPARVVLPVSMHIGAPCEPVVKVGQRVLLGEKIAVSASPVSAPVHASVSGTVAAVEACPHPNGGRMLAVVLENDGADTPHPDIRPFGSAETLTAEELIAIVRDAGLVGLGGAAFPTHTKIASGLGKVDTLIVNGAECEPYITSDHRVMLETPEEILGGVRALMKIYGLESAVIAVETNKPDAVEALRRTLPRRGDGVRVAPLATRYPQGAEKQLIRAVTGREVPPGALPAGVGAAVFNVDTVASIHRAVTTGMPLLRRIVTVSGSAVSNPKNLSVRIGTPLRAVFEATGGFREQPFKIIMGGPMMGVAQHNLDAPVVKGTNALLAFSRGEGKPEKEPVCIRCGRCVSACPMRLLPVYLYHYEQKNMLAECEQMRVNDCIECGSCSYICPGRLHLVHSFRTAKQKIREAQKRGGN